MSAEMEADLWQRIMTGQGKRILPIKILHQNQNKTMQTILIGTVKVNLRIMMDHKLEKKAQIMFLLELL